MNSLVSEQRNLESQINHLTNNIKRLKVTEKQLIKVVEKERGDINFFSAIAKENSSTLEKIKVSGSVSVSIIMNKSGSLTKQYVGF